VLLSKGEFSLLECDGAGRASQVLSVKRTPD